MVRNNGFLYPMLGFVCCIAFIYMAMVDLDLRPEYLRPAKMSFVVRNGTQFMLDGRPFYPNGWNSYWLMDQAVDEYSRPRVRAMLQAGAKMGLSVCRTWAFNDRGYNALQLSPGRYDEHVFQGLDRVLAEARQHGVRLILTLVNNLHQFGGKTQYVRWAWQQGLGRSASNDSFFYDPTIRNYFKNYVKTVLTRRNAITGIEYRNDPVILAWELMNEPRCMSDPSGDTLQEWIEEMSSFVKSIDNNHLVTVGLEGFYGPQTPERLIVNPGEWSGKLGMDFIRNFQTPTVDFASVHTYPDQWFKEDLNLDEKLKYVKKWVQSHIDDGDKMLKKPVLFAEMGLSKNISTFEPSHRDKFYKTVYDSMYKSAKRHRSGVGGFIWQFMVGGMEEYNDDFGVVPWERPSTYRLILEQSCKLAAVHLGPDQLKKLPNDVC
ncbi:mannan endo-1,4-beta-mannosidase [Ranunculus cassubicifolius]